MRQKPEGFNELNNKKAFITRVKNFQGGWNPLVRNNSRLGRVRKHV